jgi:hypothetical protein
MTVFTVHQNELYEGSVLVGVAASLESAMVLVAESTGGRYGEPNWVSAFTNAWEWCAGEAMWYNIFKTEVFEG